MVNKEKKPKKDWEKKLEELPERGTMEGSEDMVHHWRGELPLREIEKIEPNQKEKLVSSIAEEWIARAESKIYTSISEDVQIKWGKVPRRWEAMGWALEGDIWLNREVLESTIKGLDEGKSEKFRVMVGLLPTIAEGLAYMKLGEEQLKFTDKEFLGRYNTFSKELVSALIGLFKGVLPFTTKEQAEKRISKTKGEINELEDELEDLYKRKRRLEHSLKEKTEGGEEEK